uniref:F-box domain-containing protein n=2 Tax=Davidia involucrata TaxID=16924 RepID=A0A5B7B567_DAVIN
MEGTVQLPKCQKLSKEKNGSEGEDIISKLPDGVLHHILSFLSTKDAIRTSILSSRWQYLWTSISDIDLNDTLMWFGKKRENYPMCRTFFLDFVERVLLLHDASDIKRLRLTFDVHVNASRVNSWISAAIRHKVQELVLQLPLRELFVLPCCLFTCKSLAVLELRMDCDLRIPTNICFSSLKSLMLRPVTFLDDNSAQQLFSSCPVLELLALEDCEWKNIKSITISIPTLKDLTFYTGLNDEDLHDCEIKIYAANLISLNWCSNETVDFHLYDLSSLVDASIKLWNLRASQQEVARRAVKLLNSIHNTKSLKISGDIFEVLSFAENLLNCVPTFNNLTHLEVDSEISPYTTRVLMDILQKSPELEFLDIGEGLKFGDVFNEVDWMLVSVPCCFKSHLKTFSLSNFDGNASDIHLLKFMLKNAIVLESMTIYCSHNFSADVKKQEDVSSQLKMLPRGSESCVIEIQLLLDETAVVHTIVLIV